MAADFIKKVSDLDQKYKDTVNGFIRESQKVLSSDDVIPPLVNVLCLMYCYRYSDEWDKSQMNDGIVLTGDDRCVHAIPQERLFTPTLWHTIFGKKLVSSGVHKWNLEITDVYGDNSNGIEIIVGVCRDTFKEMILANLTMWAAALHTFYASTSCAPHGTKYGEKFEKVGDTIQVILDMDKRTLSYVINGNEYGVAYKDLPNAEYRLVLSLCKGRKVKLL